MFKNVCIIILAAAFFVRGQLYSVDSSRLEKQHNQEVSALQQALDAKPIEITVVVKEVPIPTIYNADELDNYCAYDWMPRKQEETDAEKQNG